jgi:hypothetical protein
MSQIPEKMSGKGSSKREVQKHISITFNYSSIEELNQKLDKLKSLESTQFPDFKSQNRLSVFIDL